MPCKLLTMPAPSSVGRVLQAQRSLGDGEMGLSGLNAVKRRVVANSLLRRYKVDENRAV